MFEFEKMKKTSFVLVATGLLSLQPANAAMPGAATIQEWFSFHAAAGWATIGASNLVIVKFSGGSSEAVVTAAVKAACGTVAGGAFSKWQPEAPGTAPGSHLAGVIKGGAVIGSSSLCGWITTGVYSIVNSYAGLASKAINDMPQASKNLVYRDISDAHTSLNAMLAFETDFQKQYANMTYTQEQFYQNNCGVPQFTKTAVCVRIKSDINKYSLAVNSNLRSLNTSGTALTTQLAKLKKDIGAWN